MFGYHGKFLGVDLSAGETRALEMEERHLKDYVGGASLAARLIYDHVKPGMEPLAPENPLVFAVGPFTGTTIPMVSRSAVCGISPLTGIWGEATTGGVFPFRLKAAGFDGIFITGRAEKPVYLYINNGKAEIRDAAQLWGKDTYQTQQVLKDELKDRSLSVSCIGQGGENLVKYACVVNDRGRVAGRCGLGALMGSKNLKAVAVTGDARPDVANKDKIDELTKQARETLSSGLMSMVYREYGTLLYMDMGMFLGDVPARYFSRNVFAAKKVTGQALRQAYTVTSHACYGCPIACGRLVKNFRKDIDVDGPEFETAVAFGPLCVNYDLDSIVQANHLCNAHGIDTISAGVSIAYAMQLYEQGILDEKKAGIKLEWGNSRSIVKLVEMIIGREGIGKLLGEGTRRMAQELGADPATAAHVKGLEMPMHDARAFTGMAISYATGPRGACHLKGDYYNIGMAGSVPELDIKSGNRFRSEGEAEMAARYQNLKDMYDSLLLCKFSSISLTQIAEILSNITGRDYSPLDINTVGERSINLKRAISNRLGVTREDDKLPTVCTTELKEGGTADRSPDMDVLLREYYDYRKWDWETGKPTKDKLLELGLEDAARDLWSS
ncbi:MAG: aldehyde ferredoxin oxidoreductase family protein [Dehalococcoidales bacterium]|nr:MAG: aldehyde ferredoxin oxidoreductase family protein [Dehalococcoidales bacterium]